MLVARLQHKSVTGETKFPHFLTLRNMTFEKLNKEEFRLTKNIWTENDRFSAHCIGLVEDGDRSFKGNVKYVWPEALHKFLYECFTFLYGSDKANEKKHIFSTLKSMYKSHRRYTKDQYLSKIDYDRTLYKHQQNAIAEMIYHKFNFLSFDMGLGKTITSATMSKIMRIKRTIIIAPAGVKWNWYHDMTDEWGFDPIYWTILDAKKNKCIKAFLERFVVINYEMINRHWDHLVKQEVGHIIIDECHLIKNHKTGRYKSVEKLVRHFQDARVTLLSGTPITNRVNDLFAYFKLANHPLGNNMSYFMNRYTHKIPGFKGEKIVGAKNIDELSMRQANFMIRKKTEECLDLPPLIINKYYLEDTEITDEYKKTLADMYQNRMKAAQDSESVEQLENLTENVHSLNRILATSKAKKIIELIDKIREQGRKVIVFATYKAALAALETHYGFACVKITGDVNAHKRDTLINRFLNDPKCQVFLGNVKAAGVGINLVNASDVIFMNFPFTPDDIEQPQKRAHRIGQKKSVNVYYTIVKNSIDEHIYDLIIDKSTDINSVLDKGKKGVVHYGNVENKVFNKLINQYAEEHGLETVGGGKFTEV
jgi:SWI/SNF-related matrix-associated actin-dependent regulator 1 of chromatin subfamily A